MSLSPPGGQILPVAALPPSELQEVLDALERLLHGQEVNFPLDLLGWEGLAPFPRQVLRTVLDIPRGEVSSYQLVALALGKPKAARAVGQALARNPFPLLIPCHRVVRGDGHLGGFSPGISLKQALLEAEGVPVDARGRVKIPSFYLPRPGSGS